MSRASTDAPQTTRVMQDIRQRIDSRRLGPGSRLPSIRAQAQALQVAKSTVVDAYERLVAEGLIEAKPGSGFYVANRLSPLNLADTSPHQDRDIDPVWVNRQSLDSEPDTLKPGCGWLPADWLPEAEIRKALRSLSRQPLAPLTGYGTLQGSAELRQLLAQRIGGRGILASLDQLMLTDSGTQAIDLLCRFFIEPGDCVLLDDPCYASFQAILRAHRAQVVGVPYTRQGPDIQAFERCLIEHRPKLYITNAALHNPTGASLSFEVAHRLLGLAESHSLTIIEDDVHADFESRPAPRLAAMDGLRRVIHTGSFSKTLSASVRLGYIAARPDWLAGLVDLKLATAFESGHLLAELLLGLLRSGAYRRHLEALRARLSAAMASTLERLRALDIEPWLEPRGGLFLWARLPAALDAKQLARRALFHQVLLAPGNVFSLSHNADSFLRFNVAQSLSPRVFQVLEQVMEQQLQAQQRATS